MTRTKGKYLKTDEKTGRTNIHCRLSWSVVFLLFIHILPATYAQETIPAAGGTSNGEGGSVSFTIGQVVYTVLPGPEQSVIQGVQQPYEISVVTFSEEILIAGIDIQAYPNPAIDFVTLRVESVLDKHFQPLAYELFDITGRVLEKKPISESHTNIAMSHLSPATYFLKVYNTSGIRSSVPNLSVQSKTFKIIKK